MKRKNREKLEEQLKKVIDDLRLNSSNGELFDKQMDKLMSLKSQVDVEPSEINIPSSNVIDECDFGSFGITRTKNEIIFGTNGYRVIVKPWVARLYMILDFICDVNKKGGKASKEDKKMYDTLLPVVSLFMIMPMFSFMEDKLTAELYQFVVDAYNGYVERRMKDDLQPETEAEDNKFENKVNMFEDLNKDVKR